MFNFRKLLLYCSALGIFLSLSSESSLANKPIWSKSATSFRFGCDEDERKECKPLKIFSPDRKSFVQISYVPNPRDPSLERVTLTVVREGKLLGSADPPGTVEDEILWAPDSKAFFINGNNNANTDYHLIVYRLEKAGVTVFKPATDALQDMVHSFPPCRAKNAMDNCKARASDPGGYIGIAGLDWIEGSSAVVVMAEVSESSEVGGILGQVLGYELEVSTGRILRRMEPKEFARRWQHSMAWKFEIPDPPEYAKD